MTEANQVDAAVRRYLGPLGRFKRVSNSVEPGWPDFHYTIRGVSGWLEDKLIPSSRRCPKTFTREQLMWGEDEIAAGGRWYLLGLEPRSRTWFLLNSKQARWWFDGQELMTIVTAQGAFPMKEIALTLAPRIIYDHHQGNTLT